MAGPSWCWGGQGGAPGVQGGCQLGSSTENSASHRPFVRHPKPQHVCNPSSSTAQAGNCDHYPMDERQTLKNTGWG